MNYIGNMILKTDDGGSWQDMAPWLGRHPVLPSGVLPDSLWLLDATSRAPPRLDCGDARYGRYLLAVTLKYALRLGLRATRTTQLRDAIA